MNCLFRGIALTVLLAGVSNVGCKPADERVPLQVVHTPLEIDPMDRHEFTGWWSNGRELLRLNPDSSYTMWPTQNRYHTPIERGRWSQQSYAVLRLEAYTRYRTDPKRVRVVRVNGEIGIQPPGLDPMRMIDYPPLMPEDQLFGTWRGEAGTLRLLDTMRYSFSPRGSRGSQPLVLVGHEGRWQLVDDVIELRPDAPGIEVIRLPLTAYEDRRSLEYAAGDFHMQP
jgi:hypothetical protein